MRENVAKQGKRDKMQQNVSKRSKNGAKRGKMRQNRATHGETGQKAAKRDKTQQNGAHTAKWVITQQTRKARQNA